MKIKKCPECHNPVGDKRDPNNIFNQVETDRTFQGRKQFASKFRQVDFREFISSISDPEEWAQWKTFVEGELVTDNDHFDRAMKALKQPHTIFMVDQVNKIMHYMNRETYDHNLDPS
jgi:hypothetical protein